MAILTRIFDVESGEEEVYILKLEALWFLISLSMVDLDEAKLLLLSDFGMTSIMESSTMKDPKEIKEEASNDFYNEKSAILERINRLLKVALNNQASACLADMKVLSLVL